MRVYFYLFIFCFTACSDASDTVASTHIYDVCDIDFYTKKSCVYTDLTVDLQTESVSTDEKLLVSLGVIYKELKQTLNISPDTSILEGDKGYISFKDINFDGFPDIAITTSFGVANLYLDYWVFNTKNQKYAYLGNYAELKLDQKNKNLSNVIKINAANYETNTYKWDDFKLKQVSKQ